MRNEEVFKQAPVEGKARPARTSEAAPWGGRADICRAEAAGEVFEGLRAEPSDAELRSRRAQPAQCLGGKVLAD